MQPFQDASLVSREQYKLALETYKAQLTPAQTAAIAEEKRQRVAKRKAIRRKKVSVTLHHVTTILNHQLFYSLLYYIHPWFVLHNLVPEFLRN